MNISKKEKDKMFEIYVICYKQMCKEIDEMTKSHRVEFTEEDIEPLQRCDLCKEWYEHGYSRHAKTKKHMRYMIDENKHLLEWRAFNYMNKLNSNK